MHVKRPDPLRTLLGIAAVLVGVAMLIGAIALLRWSFGSGANAEKGGPAPTEPARAGGLTWEAAAPFERRAPKSSMRVAEYVALGRFPRLGLWRRTRHLEQTTEAELAAAQAPGSAPAGVGGAPPDLGDRSQPVDRAGRRDPT